jgi:small-conductance mechanosensitive channel
VTDDLIRLLFPLVLGLAGVAALQIVHVVLLRAGRQVGLATHLARRTHRPAQVMVALGSVWLGVRLALNGRDWSGPTLHLLGLALIVAGAWFFAALLFVVEDTALAHYRTDVRDNRVARTVHTQVRLIRRVTVAGVTVLTIGTMLLTLPGARTAGASVLASAGLVGVVAALAAQSVLGNMLAGLQIAFGKSLRLDDVVVVEGEWGRIEEITLTYVVVRIWDDRRLIMPTSYFTTKPFENWTRTSAALTGTVELDVDWAVPMPRLRAKLTAVLEDNPLWDERTNVLQVTDAVGGAIRVRALVSAHDAPTLWDLRCAVRESLVTWLREQHGEALPRVRGELFGDVAFAAAPNHDVVRTRTGDGLASAASAA